MNPFFPLAPLFFIISFFYSAVGLGGGSAYIAALALSGISHIHIPLIALSLNLIVSGSSWFGYFLAGYFQPRLLFPLVISSVPAAFLGGLIHLSAHAFYLILSSTLFLTAVWILASKEILPSGRHLIQSKKIFVASIIGGALGLLSGMVGIGGGIFLGPILLSIRWTDAKQTAAITSAFIFLNSLSGLSVRLSNQLPDLSIWLSLVAVVLLGGQVGAYAGANYFSIKSVQRSLGVALLFAALMIGGKAL